MSNVAVDDDDDPPSAAPTSMPAPSNPRSSPVSSQPNTPPAKLGAQQTTTTSSPDAAADNFPAAPTTTPIGKSSTGEGKDGAEATSMDGVVNEATNASKEMEKDDGASKEPSSSQPMTAFRVIRVPGKPVSPPEEPQPPRNTQSEPPSQRHKSTPQKEEEEEGMDVQEEEEETPPPMARLLPQRARRPPTAPPRMPPPPDPPLPAQAPAHPPPIPPLPAPESTSTPPPTTPPPPPKRAEPILKPIPSPPWASDGFRPDNPPPPRTRETAGAPRGRGRGAGAGGGRGRGRGTGNGSGSRTRGRETALPRTSAASMQQQQRGREFPSSGTMPAMAAPAPSTAPPTNHYPNSYTYPAHNIEPIPNQTGIQNPYHHLTRGVRPNSRDREEDDRATQAMLLRVAQTQRPNQSQQRVSPPPPPPIQSGAPRVQAPHYAAPVHTPSRTIPDQMPYAHPGYNGFFQFQVQPQPLQFQHYVQASSSSAAPPSLSASAPPVYPSRREITPSSTYQPSPSSSLKRTRSQSPLPAPPPPPPWYTPAQAQAHTQAHVQAQAHARSQAPARGSMSSAVGLYASMQQQGSGSGWAVATSGIKRLKISANLFEPSSPSPSPAPAFGGYVRRAERSASRSRSWSRSVGRGRGRSRSRSRSRGRSVSFSRSRSPPRAMVNRRWRSMSRGKRRSRSRSWSDDAEMDHRAGPATGRAAPQPAGYWGRGRQSGLEMDVVDDEGPHGYPWTKKDKGKGREQDLPPNHAYSRRRSRSLSPMRIDPVPPPRRAPHPHAHWTSTGRLPSPIAGLRPAWTPSSPSTRESQPSASSASSTAVPVPSSPLNYNYDYAIEHSPSPSHADLLGDVDDFDDGRRAGGYPQPGMALLPRPRYVPSPPGMQSYGPPVHVSNRSRSQSRSPWHSTSLRPPEHPVRDTYTPPPAPTGMPMGAQSYAYLAMQPQPPPRAPVIPPELAPTLVVLQEDGQHTQPVQAKPLRRSVASMAKDHAAEYARGQRPPKRLVSPRRAQAEADARAEADAEASERVWAQLMDQQRRQFQEHPELQPQTATQKLQYCQQLQAQYHHLLQQQGLPPRHIPIPQNYRDTSDMERMEEVHREQQWNQQAVGSASMYQGSSRSRPLPRSGEHPSLHRVIVPSASSGHAPPSPSHARTPSPAQATHYQQNYTIQLDPQQISETTAVAKVRSRKPGPKPLGTPTDGDRPDRIVSMRTIPQPPPQVVAQKLAAQLGIPMGSTDLRGTLPPAPKAVDDSANATEAGSPDEGDGNDATPPTAPTGSGLGAGAVLPPDLQVGAHLKQMSDSSRPAQKAQKAKHRKSHSAQPGEGEASSSTRTHKPTSSSSAGPAADGPNEQLMQFGPLQHFQTTLFPQEHLLLDMHSVGGAQFVLKPPRNVRGGRGVYGSYGVVVDGMTGGSAPVNGGNIVDGGPGPSGSTSGSSSQDARGRSAGANGRSGSRRSSGGSPGGANDELHNVLVVKRRRVPPGAAPHDPAASTPHVVGGRLMTPPPEQIYAGQVHANDVAVAVGEERGKLRGRQNGAMSGKGKRRVTAAGQDKRSTASLNKGKAVAKGQRPSALGTAQAPLTISDEEEEPRFNANIRVIRGPPRSPDAPPIQVHTEDSPPNVDDGPDESESDEEDELESEDSNGGAGYKAPIPQLHTASTLISVPAPVTRLRRSTRTSSAPSTSRSSSHARNGDARADLSAAASTTAKKPRKKRRSMRIHSPVDPTKSTLENTFPKPPRPSRKGKKYPCDMCDQIFTRSGDVRRHKDTRHNKEEGSGCVCSFCGRVLTRQDALQRHWEKYCRKKSERHLSRSRAGQAQGMGVYGLMHRSYLDPLPHDTSGLVDSFVAENDELRVAMAMATAMVQNVSAGGSGAGPSTAPSPSRNGSQSRGSSTYGQQFPHENDGGEQETDDGDDDEEEEEEEDEEEGEGMDGMYVDLDTQPPQPSNGPNDNEAEMSGVE